MLKTLYYLEALLWLSASVLAVWVIMGTLAVAFPLRTRSLWWEAALLVIAMILSGLAAARGRRGRALLQPTDTPNHHWAVARVVLRLVLLLPWAFALLVAAAGFSA